MYYDWKAGLRLIANLKLKTENCETVNCLHHPNITLLLCFLCCCWSVFTAILGTGLPDCRVVYQHNHDWTKTMNMNMHKVHSRFYSKMHFQRGLGNDCFL